MGVPQPADLTSLVMRTDFSDDQAWETLQATINTSWEYPCAHLRQRSGLYAGSWKCQMTSVGRVLAIRAANGR